MTFEEFQASAREMRIAEYETVYGTSAVSDFANPGDTIRAYKHGGWIMAREDGTYWLILEHDEFDTSDGKTTLADLERELFGWLDNDEAAIIATQEHGLLAEDWSCGKPSLEDLKRYAESAADYAEKRTGTRPIITIDEDENITFSTNWPKGEQQRRLDALAKAMMATRPDLKEMSLDEWLVQHSDSLSEKERDAATAISALYDAD